VCTCNGNVDIDDSRKEFDIIYLGQDVINEIIRTMLKGLCDFFQILIPTTLY
jgi:hypothetical protein